MNRVENFNAQRSPVGLEASRTEYDDLLVVSLDRQTCNAGSVSPNQYRPYVPHRNLRDDIIDLWVSDCLYVSFHRTLRASELGRWRVPQQGGHCPGHPQHRLRYHRHPYPDTHDNESEDATQAARACDYDPGVGFWVGHSTTENTDFTKLTFMQSRRRLCRQGVVGHEDD